MLAVFTITLSLTVQHASPSVSTLAAAAVLEVNVKRQWPTDERGPAVTGEALHLMAKAARAIADDWRVDDGKLRQSMIDFEAAREALLSKPRDDRDRPKLAREALDKGRAIIDLLATALNCEEETMKDRLVLKKSVEDFDQKKPVTQQVDQLEKYFQQAAQILQTLLDTATTNHRST